MTDSFTHEERVRLWELAHARAIYQAELMYPRRDQRFWRAVEEIRHREYISMVRP